MTPASLRRVAVLGGGVCGLATAWRLLKLRPDLKVVIFESEAESGGLARTLNLNGLRADLGPHRFHTEIAESLEFLRDLAGDELVEVKRRSLMWLRKRWVDYPPRPAEMLRVLGPFRLGHFAVSGMIEKIAQGLAFLSLPGGDSRESFCSVMTRAFGPALYRFMVQPYAEKVWKTPATSIHADIARVRVSAGGLERLVRQAFSRGKAHADPAALKKYIYIKGGYGRIAERMVEEIKRLGGDVCLGRMITGMAWGQSSNEAPEADPKKSHSRARWRIRHVSTPQGTHSTAQTAQQWQIEGSLGTVGEEETDVFDAVVSTLPLNDLVAMLADSASDADAENCAQGLRFLANTLVFLELGSPPPLDAQWLYFPQPELLFNRGYLPACFHEPFGAEGRSLVCLEVTGFAGDDTWRLNDEEIGRRVAEQAAEIGLVAPGILRHVHVIRIPYTYPMYDLEYRWRVDRVLRYLERFPGLLTTGRQGLFLHNNVDHSIYTGLKAADALLTHPQAPGPQWYSRIEEFRSFRIID